MNFQRLIDILTLKRGHTSAGERKLIEQILMPYKPGIITDNQGVAMAFTLSTADPSVAPVLYTCHIDTVHDPKQDARQVVLYDAETEMAYKHDDFPLGADDGAGVWLLLEMFDAKIPGSYIFFRGEERGGIGSSSAAKTHPDWFRQFKYAIAFDRRDTCSVITRQGGGRCCSDEFAQALADMLNDGTYELRPDPGGVYTDTAELTHLIPECTNVSVGYYNEHSKQELLDTAYLKWLRERLLRIDATSLPVKRDPAAVDDWRNDSLWQHYGWDWNYNKTPQYASTTPTSGSLTPAKTKKRKAKGNSIDYIDPLDNPPYDAYSVCELRYRELVRWVEAAAPEDIADLLSDLAEQVLYGDEITAAMENSYENQ